MSGLLRVGPRRGVALALLLLLAGALLGGCSSGSDLADPVAPAAESGEPTAVYAAIGGIETLNSDRDDIQDNWPQLVFGESLPAGAVYVNVATEGATARSALSDQMPQAASLDATVVTVWVESADVRQGTDAAVYRDQLTRLVRGLQAVGTDQILLLTPTREQVGGAGALADSVALVARDTGAVLVDLGDTSDRQDDSGQRRIAAAVSAAMGTS